MWAVTFIGPIRKIGTLKSILIQLPRISKEMDGSRNKIGGPQKQSLLGDMVHDYIVFL